MKKLAVILPTVKQYDISAKLAVNSIIDSIERNKICNYDIFVHGPNDPCDPRINFLKEEKQNGENVAINNVVKRISSDYDYFFLTADDHIITSQSNLLDTISYLEGETFKNRKMKICTVATVLDSPCFSPDYLPFPAGSKMGRYYIPEENHRIPNFMICRFPFISKDTLNEYLNKKIFPEFVYSGYGDSCLSYFLFQNDEPCLEFNNVKLSFMEHIHDIDRIERHKDQWIELRNKSCINAYNFIKNYSKGNKYE